MANALSINCEVFCGCIIGRGDIRYCAGNYATDASVLKCENVHIFFFSAGGRILRLGNEGVVEHGRVVGCASDSALSVGVDDHHTDAIVFDILLRDTEF